MENPPAVTNTQVLEAAKSMSTKQKKEFVHSVFPLPDRVNGLYWLVLGTACLIMILCILRLTGVFILFFPDKPGTFWELFPDEDKITGIFTTVLSFVVGMFVPSPVAGNKQTSGSDANN